jgi:hypothetical protein
MNTRKDPPPSHLGRIKKTTKPSGTQKKSEVFDFYNTLEETARLTSDTSPILNPPPTKGNPNLHEETSNRLSSQEKEENKIKSPSSPLKQSYLQSKNPFHSRYHSFKYLQRPQQPSSPKEQIDSDSTPSSIHSLPQAPNPKQNGIIPNKESTSEDQLTPEHQDHFHQHQTTPPKNLNQEKLTQKQPEKIQTPQTYSTPMNTTIHTNPSTPSPRSTDFRDNIRRQSNDQKSIGRIITIISISFAALIIACLSLAIYGGYVIWSRLNDQSATLADVEKKFATRVSTLQASIDRLQIELHRTQKYNDELARQNQEITRALREQQEIARRNKAQIDTLSNQIRQEKTIRDQQIRELTRELARHSTARLLPSTPAISTNNRTADRPSPFPNTAVRR